MGSEMCIRDSSCCFVVVLVLVLFVFLFLSLLFLLIFLVVALIPVLVVFLVVVLVDVLFLSFFYATGPTSMKGMRQSRRAVWGVSRCRWRRSSVGA